MMVMMMTTTMMMMVILDISTHPPGRGRPSMGESWGTSFDPGFSFTLFTSFDPGLSIK